MSGGPWFDVRGFFRGEQWKAGFVLLLATVLEATWWCFGRREFYWETVYPQWPQFVLDGNPQRTAALWSFLSAFVLLGLVPALAVKLVLRERLADYGLQFGDRRWTFWSLATLGPVFVVAGYTSACDPAFAGQYPTDPSAGASREALAWHALGLLAYYAGWEFHFRGFLQFGLRRAMGDANAALVVVMASCLIHFGKPVLEVYSAILGSLLWSLVALRTRSILSGLAQHFLLGLSLDGFLLFG